MIIIIQIIELICLAFAAGIAALWVQKPSGNFEPFIVFCSSLAVILDFVRRYLRSSRLTVFLSVGTTYTKIQEDFVKSFERFLLTNGHKSLIVGRDCPTALQPMLQVRNLMKKSDAVVVLAFTRYIVNSAIEKPGAELAKQKTTEIKNIKYTTVWNQIEAGIAFGQKIPILIIIEEGVKQEAMLKDRHEFKAIKASIEPDFFETDNFKTIFNDFCSRVRKRSWFRL